jgi:hypothetical protein
VSLCRARARQVDHPHVIRCLEIAEVSPGGTVVMVMEALLGGEVLARLGAMDRYSEDDAAGVFTQVGRRGQRGAGGDGAAAAWGAGGVQRPHT